MRSQELADEVADTIARTTARVLGTGDQQYSEGEVQRFERMTSTELLDWALEELDDLIVYAVMTGIQIKRLKRALS